MVKKKRNVRIFKFLLGKHFICVCSGWFQVVHPCPARKTRAQVPADHLRDSARNPAQIPSAGEATTLVCVRYIHHHLLGSSRYSPYFGTIFRLQLCYGLLENSFTWDIVTLSNKKIEFAFYTCAKTSHPNPKIPTQLRKERFLLFLFRHLIKRRDNANSWLE